MLDVGRDDLVVRPKPEAAQDDVAALRCRARQRDVFDRHVDERSQSGAQTPAELCHVEKLRDAPAAGLELCGEPRRHRGGRPLRQRPDRARVEVREALEHGELGANLVERHVILTSTGEWSLTTTPLTRRREIGQRSGALASAPRTRT